MAVAHDITPFISIYKSTEVRTPIVDSGETNLLTYIRTGL